AHVDVTFWLTSPADAVMTIPATTRVATQRGEVDEPVVFSTLSPLEIVPSTLATIATRAHDVDAMRTRTDQLNVGTEFPAFGDEPTAGDSLYVGLDRAAPGMAIALRFDCHIDGVGVDPTDPPLVWEAWTGDEWEAC